jgi:hypothetical protein
VGELHGVAPGSRNAAVVQVLHLSTDGKARPSPTTKAAAPAPARAPQQLRPQHTIHWDESLLHTMNIEEKKLVKKGTEHGKPKPYPGRTITKEFQQSANFINSLTTNHYIELSRF